ncbi:putative DNA-binding transcriptional regulator AlpA [Desulfomicrobium macestii]|uniref:DNA-binding transcriptional regulator AlpA n=1 Tax=Desulfomicrobium macestii TaxID=90731 RepID=A0ABR9H7Y0_9BACT|nr:helix-turn-helix domain-containing protein [Desulfomicrobium macestii]MBE1426785.1 putative DNA-binding transcriptional regulator AlpA [Desulfomicrobium macestii]
MGMINEPKKHVDYIPNVQRTMREQEAAAYLGMSVKTLQAWRFYNKGPKYLKISRSVRYLREDLDTFLEASKITPIGER